MKFWKRQTAIFIREKNEIRQAVGLRISVEGDVKSGFNKYIKASFKNKGS